MKWRSRTDRRLLFGVAAVALVLLAVAEVRYHNAVAVQHATWTVVTGVTIMLLVLGLTLRAAHQEEGQRRRSDHAARQSEERYLDLFENARDLIQSVEADGRIRGANRVWRETLGYAEAELSGLSLWDVIAPESLEESREAFRKVLASGIPDPRIEVSFVARGGRRVVLEGGIRPVLADGHATSTMAILRDVTESRRLERLHAAQNEVARALNEGGTFETAISRTLDGLARSLRWDFARLWLVDDRAGLLRPGPAWSSAPALFDAFMAASAERGLARGEGLPGRAWRQGAPVVATSLLAEASFPKEAAHARLRSAVACPLRLGDEVLGVLELLTRQPEAPVTEVVLTLESVGSQIGQFMVRARAQQSLQESEARTRSIIDNMQGGLITVDAEGNIESINHAAEKIFGYTSEQLQGSHLSRLVPEQPGIDARAFLKEAFTKAIGRLTEWEGRRQNGQVFPFELSMFEFESTGGRHFGGAVRDITERRDLERAKQEFVATVSHELRTPLTSVRGALTLLSGGALGDLPDEAREVVAIAERNALRLIGLINDILDLERMETGRLEMHLAPLSVSPLLEHSLESVRGMAETSGVLLVAEPTKAWAFGDADRLSQVIVNLLSNAVKFSTRGGTVTVSAEEGEGVVEFRVRDRGRGVPAAHREAIFERFRQVEASDARDKGGTGLGLAICKSIVEQHGGQIGVESEEGVGSTFWFRIPTAPPAHDPDADPLLATLPLGLVDANGKYVLLVDDDEALLGVMARQLLQNGIAVSAATTGKDAVRRAIEHPPRLLVLDVNLSDEDGFWVISQLREQAALAALPVLVYTVHDLSQDQRRQLTLGPTRVLTKSRTTDAELLATVKSLMAETTA